MKTIKYLTLALTGLFIVACNQEKPIDSAFYDLTKGKEKEVLINYAANTLLSMHLAEIAVQNAGSEQVRGLAATIAKDQREIYGELEKLAADMDIRLPQMFMQKQTDVIKTMRSKEGTSMDNAFVNIVAVYDQAFGDEMEKTLQAKNANTDVLKFARFVDDQRAVHQNKAKMLKAQIKA